MTVSRPALARSIVDALCRRFPAVDTDFEDNDPHRTSKLPSMFGSAIYEQLAGRRVIDFGSGRGADAVAAALNGANVVGIDIQAHFIRVSRALAEQHGVTERCWFMDPASDRSAYEALYGTCDYLISVDAFEHFREPKAALREMYDLLKPGGMALISFGPPWLHPYGAHMTHFSRFPWIHFVFSEKAVLASAARQGLDRGARTYEDTIAHPNRMTVAQFQTTLAATAFECRFFRCVPVKGLSWLTAVPYIREFFTSLVRCELRKPAAEVRA